MSSKIQQPSSPSPEAFPDSGRCRFTFADGRRCGMPRWRKHPSLCLSHARQEQQLLAVDQVGRELASLSGEFRTANDVNHVLGKVFALFSRNQIARRDAVVYAYIGQLLLQTIPSVREELRTALGWYAWNDKLHQALCRPRDEVQEEENEAGPEEGPAPDENIASEPQAAAPAISDPPSPPGEEPPPCG